MKTRTVNPKELVAWIVLIFAIVLLGVSAVLAQDKKKKEDGTIHISIVKEENGKKTKIDTTVAAKDLPALKEYLKGKNIDFDTDVHGKRIIIKNGDGEEDIVMNLDSDIKNNIKKNLNEKEMKELQKEMEKMKDEMKDIHIEINRDGDDGEDGNFDFNMAVPPHVSSPYAYSYSFNDNGDTNRNNFRHSFHFFNDDNVPDSLRDDEHVIIHGREGEEKPVFDREITTKDGEKVWIYKRKLPADAEITKRKGEGMGITRLKVYPNPSDGNISVSFRAAAKGDVNISITDTNGKEVFSKTMKDFEGEYFEQVDISGKGKGTYYIKITAGDDIVSKKVLVN